MKYLKNHDTIALIVLMIVVLSAYVMKNTVIKQAEYVKNNNVSHTEYTDIDVQTTPFLD
jgi:predicted ABC-type sugar transport system permease subunit